MNWNFQDYETIISNMKEGKENDTSLKIKGIILHNLKLIIIKF